MIKKTINGAVYEFDTAFELRQYETDTHHKKQINSSERRGIRRKYTKRNSLYLKRIARAMKNFVKNDSSMASEFQKIFKRTPAGNDYYHMNKFVKALTT